MNTIDPAQLLPSLRAYLRANGVARAPSDFTDLTIPPMWIDPRKGIPYPGQTEGLESPDESNASVVMGLYPEAGIPSRPFEGFYRQDAAVIWIIALTSPLVRQKFEQIKPLLHDQRNFTMDGFQVNQSMLYRDLTRIGSDANGFTYNCAFLFDIWDDSDHTI